MRLFACEQKKEIILNALNYLKKWGLSNVIHSLCPIKGKTDLASSFAAIRIIRPESPLLNEGPLPAEIRFEEARLRECRCGKGPVYDGFRYAELVRKYLPEDLDYLVEKPVFITLDYIATYPEEEKRYHLRYAAFTFPVVVSLQGIIEAPARPREYYLAQAQAQSLVQAQALAKAQARAQALAQAQAQAQARTQSLARAKAQARTQSQAQALARAQAQALTQILPQTQTQILPQGQAQALSQGLSHGYGASLTEEWEKDFLTGLEDSRLPRVLAGLLLQAWFYYEEGYPFCSDPNCALFNAHWQKDLLRSQSDEPYILCKKHKINF